MNQRIVRRDFPRRTAALAGAVIATPLTRGAAEASAKRTAVDQVTLGNTGVTVSRLGIGMGSNRGNDRDMDAVVIGFKSTQEIDESVEPMNRALRELAWRP
jgi:hypothetical protein